MENLKSIILDYLDKYPIESFREYEQCGEGYSDCCKGSYNPNRGHSNFDTVLVHHARKISPRTLTDSDGVGISNPLTIDGVEISNYQKIESRETYWKVRDALPNDMMPLFNARFLLGYGINEIRDFLALRQDLFHLSCRPGSVANVMKYPYNNGRDLAYSITKGDNKKLLGIMKGAADVLTPMHQEMDEKWRTLNDETDWDKLRRLMIEDFGDRLRNAEKELYQRFQDVGEMLKIYVNKAD